MGLDMYLEGKRFISSHFARDRNIRKRLEPFAEDGLRVCGLTYDIAYWRKANAIHNWFCENIEGGVNNCKEVIVPERLLKELKGACEKTINEVTKFDKKIIQMKADWNVHGDIIKYTEAYDVPENYENHLPPTEGFFFGSTAINDGYIDDLKYTIKIIDNALELSEKFNMCGYPIKFIYLASW